MPRVLWVQRWRFISRIRASGLQEFSPHTFGFLRSSYRRNGRSGTTCPLRSIVPMNFGFLGVLYSAPLASHRVRTSRIQRSSDRCPLLRMTDMNCTKISPHVTKSCDLNSNFGRLYYFARPDGLSLSRQDQRSRAIMGRGVAWDLISRGDPAI